MNRSIDVRTDLSFGAAQILPGLPTAYSWDCDIDATMLAIGYLTAPPRFQGLSLSHYWAWLRYRVALQPTGSGLRLRSVWGEIDSHQKTILSDDFGMGFPCHYLIDQHGFEDFADTKFLIKHLLGGIVAVLGSDLRGPSKSPDFIAVDNTNRLHILECKGSQSSRKSLQAAIARGIPQKNNLSNGTLFTSCMVGGIFVPQYHSNERAEIVFADPKVDDLLAKLGDLGPEKVAAGVRRISLAKTLSMLGLWKAASAVVEGRVQRQDVGFVRDLAHGELAFAGFARDDGNRTWRRTIEFRSLDIHPRLPTRSVSVTTTLTLEVPPGLVELFTKAVKQDGKVNYEEIDQWINTQLTQNRVRRVVKDAPVQQPAKGSGGTVEAERVVESSWSRVDSGGANFGESQSRGWRISSGVQMSVERREASTA